MNTSTNLAKPRPAVIVDLDGTLVDVAPFLHHVQGPHKDFDAFHNQTNAHGQPVNWVISMCEQAYRDGYTIIVLTGRPTRHLEASLSWCRRHLKVPFVGPIARGHGDNRSDVEVKREAFIRLRSIYKITGAIDDRPGVLALWRELNLNPIVSLRPDWADAGEHYSDADLTAWATQEQLRIAHGWAPQQDPGVQD